MNSGPLPFRSGAGNPAAEGALGRGEPADRAPSAPRGSAWPGRALRGKAAAPPRERETKGPKIGWVSKQPPAEILSQRSVSPKPVSWTRFADAQNS